MKKLKAAVTYVFAIVGAFAVFSGCAFLLLRHLGQSYDEFSLSGKHPSRDGKYIAQIYQRSGGAAVPAEWCASGVAVLPSTETASQQNVVDARVYESDCDSKVDILWTSDSVLLVSFSGAYTPLGTDAYLRGYNKDKTIRVEFAFVSD